MINKAKGENVVKKIICGEVAKNRKEVNLRRKPWFSPGRR